MKTTSSLARQTLLTIALATFISGCDNEPTAVVITEGGKAGNSEPTQYTLDKNQALLQELPFHDNRDFEEASRGLIATADNLVVKHARTGDVIWNMPAYAFIEGNAPATVNPSLWRQAKLNNTAGLYQVKEGIWQLRNFDLSTLSIIKGKTGWILVDPGVSK
jgi:alkyl sulfatase BDS1-like metallo-beta-lactamase superfamily hydrolase